MATETEHIAAVIALLDAGGAVPYSVQRKQRVEVTPPDYTRVQVERLPVPVTRGTGTTERRRYFIGLTVYGRTEGSARALRDAAAAAFEAAVTLLIAGVPTTPITFDGSSEIDLDGGKYTGSESYTYVH